MLIYCDIDQMDNGTEIILNGTYIDAYRNASFDYLALIIPLEKSTMKCT